MYVYLDLERLFKVQHILAERSLKQYLAGARAQQDKHERRASRRCDRKERNEHEDQNFEDEYAQCEPKMLEAPSAPAQDGASSNKSFPDLRSSTLCPVSSTASFSITLGSSPSRFQECGWESSTSILMTNGQEKEKDNPGTPKRVEQVVIQTDESTPRESEAVRPLLKQQDEEHINREEKRSKKAQQAQENPEVTLVTAPMVGSSSRKRSHSEMVAGTQTCSDSSLQVLNHPSSSLSDTVATRLATKVWNDEAPDTTALAGAISPHVGSSQGNNTSSAPHGDCADSHFRTEGKATGSSPAVQALLSRWLGNNASAVFLSTMSI